MNVHQKRVAVLLAGLGFLAILGHTGRWIQDSGREVSPNKAAKEAGAKLLQDSKPGSFLLLPSGSLKSAGRGSTPLLMVTSNPGGSVVMTTTNLGIARESGFDPLDCSLCNVVRVINPGDADYAAAATAFAAGTVFPPTK